MEHLPPPNSQNPNAQSPPPEVGQPPETWVQTPPDVGDLHSLEYKGRFMGVDEYNEKKAREKAAEEARQRLEAAHANAEAEDDEETRAPGLEDIILSPTVTGAETERPKVTEEEKIRALLERLRSGLFIEGTTLPADSPDVERIVVDSDHEDPYVDSVPDEFKFPIPSLQYTSKKASEVQPRTLFDRMVSRLATQGYMTAEDFGDSLNKVSRNNEQAMKLLNELQNTGPDKQIRSLWSREVSPGVFVNVHDGSEVKPALARDARKKWMSTPSAFQAALWYEINKSTSEGQFSNTVECALELLNEATHRSSLDNGVRFSDDDVIGVIVGVGFMHKGQHLSFKHAKITKNEVTGNYEYKGIDGVKFVQEMSTKFKSFELSGFSATDISNLSMLANEAIEDSIEFKDDPTSKEFKRSQFILQRIYAIVSELRYSASADPESEDELSDVAMRRSLLGATQRPPVEFSKTVDGEVKVKLGGQPIRTGSSSVASQFWSQVASYSDAAAELFPCIKYERTDDFSTAENEQLSGSSSDEAVWQRYLEESQASDKASGRTRTAAEIRQEYDGGGREAQQARTRRRRYGITDEYKSTGKKRTRRQRRRAHKDRFK